MKKRYIIRNKYYPNENLGMIELDFDKDTARFFPLKSYDGLHSGYYFTKWSNSGRKVIEGDEMQRWIRQRVCPPERQNIRDILKAKKLKNYSMTRILDSNKGHSTHDDFWFEEIKQE